MFSRFSAHVVMLCRCVHNKIKLYSISQNFIMFGKNLSTSVWIHLISKSTDRHSPPISSTKCGLFRSFSKHLCILLMNGSTTMRFSSSYEYSTVSHNLSPSIWLQMTQSKHRFWLQMNFHRSELSKCIFNLKIALLINFNSSPLEYLT